MRQSRAASSMAMALGESKPKTIRTPAMRFVLRSTSLVGSGAYHVQ